MALNPTSGKTPAEKKSAEDEILIREIDDAVRQDDVETFLKNYGTPLFAGLVAILLGFGGYLYWDSQQEAEMERQSEQLTAALDQVDAGNFEAASDAVADLVNEGGPAAKASALFLQAAAAIQAGETDRAVEIFGQIAADETTPPALRDLALIREVATNFDDREPSEVITKLSPLAVPGNAFFGSAGEMTAMAHLEAGDSQAAGTMFAAVANDEGVPSDLRDRARDMAGLLGVDVIEDVEELLEEEGIVTDDEATGPEGAPDAAAPSL